MAVVSVLAVSEFCAAAGSYASPTGGSCCFTSPFEMSRAGEEGSELGFG